MRRSSGTKEPADGSDCPEGVRAADPEQGLVNEQDDRNKADRILGEDWTVRVQAGPFQPL
jgi:hypothetical protein